MPLYLAKPCQYFNFNSNIILIKLMFIEKKTELHVFNS